MKFPDIIKSPPAAWADTWSRFWTPIARTVPDGANSSAIQPTSSMTSSPTASSNPASSTKSNNSSLTTGSKAGVGVGIGCGAILLALLGTCVYRRHHRKNQTSASSSQQEGFVDAKPFSQQSMATKVGVGPLYEADGYNPAELYIDEGSAHELSAGRVS